MARVLAAVLIALALGTIVAVGASLPYGIHEQAIAASNDTAPELTRVNDASKRGWPVAMSQRTASSMLLFSLLRSGGGH